MISPVVNLRAEFKPLLSILSVSLEFPKSILHKNVQVIIEPYQLSIRSECSTFIYEFDRLAIVPASCRSLRWAGVRELQLNLQAEQKKDDKDSNGLINHKSSPTNQDFIVSRIQSSQNHCHCVGCGAQIFKSNCHFKRVLPLPTENWSDFADIWFCHNHSHNSSPQNDISCSGDASIQESVSKLKNSPLLPRVDDCLVSSLYMLLDSSHVKTGCIAQTAGKLICKRCSNFIGFVKDERNKEVQQSGVIYKIYHHAVSFKEAESDNPSVKELNQGPAVFNCEKQQHVEDFMSCLLKDQSQIFTSFRFILTSSLQASGQSSISILLWLLDQELSVFTTLLPVSQYSGETKVKLSSKKYIKLLYKATFTTLGEFYKCSSMSKTSNIFEAWRIDNTVHGISLPYPLCKQLIHLLLSSTKSLAKSQRSLNGFHVGYLKVS